MQEAITETANEKIIDLESIVNETKATKIAIEYYTLGPTASEQDISNGKRVIVSGDDTLNYTDILVFAEIPEKFSIGEESRIKIYWHEQKKYIDFKALDLDNNGKLDYVEWIVPHLSEQIYDIIVIIAAEQATVENFFD